MRDIELRAYRWVGNPFHDTFLKLILYNFVVFCCHLGSLKFTQKSPKSAQTAILVVWKGWMISSPGQPGLVPAVGAPPQLFLELRVYKCLVASWGILQTKNIHLAQTFVIRL